MARRRAARSGNAPSIWLTVGQAAASLGVGAATVRRWTAAGDLKAFVTPGGHRRYRAADIAEIVGRLHAGDAPLTAAELGTLWSASESDAAASARTEDWHAAYDDLEKSIAREHGQELIRLAADYVADRDRRAEVVRRVLPIAREYGRQAARVGVTLGDLMAALGHFRRPLYAAIESEARERFAGVDDRSAASVLLDLAEFLDEFTIRMVEGYLDTVLTPLRTRAGTGPRPKAPH